MDQPAQLRCPVHQQPLTEDGSDLKCAGGCIFPTVNGIPRFVSSDNYASAFGRQWNKFRKTQLDSYTGTTISRERLQHCVGSSLDILKEKSVLEVGCGAGRFTEVMLAAGAHVSACDLSSAVEANYQNCGDKPNYFICQADVRALPFAPHSFDFVMCLGVIQHTPSSEQTISALAQFIKPGGMLVIDHYAPDYPTTFSRRWLRRLLLRLPPASSSRLALSLTRMLLPLHKLGWNQKRGRWRLRRQLQKFSPVVDYYDVYPQLGEKTLAEWALLDTHDTLTDYYKHLRSVEQIDSCLIACGLVDTETRHAGNGIEARARMPVNSGTTSV